MVCCMKWTWYSCFVVFHDKLHFLIGTYTALGLICINVVYFMINCIFLDGGLYLTRIIMQ